MNSNTLRRMAYLGAVAASASGCSGTGIGDDSSANGSAAESATTSAESALSGAAACNTESYDYTYMNMPDTYRGDTQYTGDNYGWIHPGCPDTWILDVRRGFGDSHNNAYARFTWQDAPLARTKAECEAHTIFGYGRIESSPGVWTETGKNLSLPVASTACQSPQLMVFAAVGRLPYAAPQSPRSHF